MSTEIWCSLKSKTQLEKPKVDKAEISRNHQGKIQRQETHMMVLRSNTGRLLLSVSSKIKRKLINSLRKRLISLRVLLATKSNKIHFNLTVQLTSRKTQSLKELCTPLIWWKRFYKVIYLWEQLYKSNQNKSMTRTLSTSNYNRKMKIWGRDWLCWRNTLEKIH